MRTVVKNHVVENGTGIIVTKQELSIMVGSVLKVDQNSFLPDDYCYNRTNKEISFDCHIHLFELLYDGRYRILGENNPYTGPVIGRKDDGQGYVIKGFWIDGIFQQDTSEFYLKMSDLQESLSATLKNATIQLANRSVIINCGSEELCSVEIMDEAY